MDTTPVNTYDGINFLRISCRSQLEKNACGIHLACRSSCGNALLVRADAIASNAGAGTAGSFYGCVADFDGDGWPDIYFVNGRDRYGRGINVRNALYRNNRDGTFTDVTEKAGVPGTGFGLGCVWGDYDNDGFPDLFVTQFGKNVLYHNNGDGTFTDVTDKAGVGGLETGNFHSGATFVDYDRDGKLDLYVGTYVTMDPETQRYCKVSGVLTSCPPTAYKGSPNALYHNNGDGTFTNVTKSAKVLEPDGKGLSVGAADFDNDGWPDIFGRNGGNGLLAIGTTHGRDVHFARRL